MSKVLYSYGYNHLCITVPHFQHVIDLCPILGHLGALPSPRATPAASTHLPHAPQRPGGRCGPGTATASLSRPRRPHFPPAGASSEKPMWRPGPPGRAAEPRGRGAARGRQRPECSLAAAPALSPAGPRPREGKATPAPTPRLRGHWDPRPRTPAPGLRILTHCRKC